MTNNKEESNSENDEENEDEVIEFNAKTQKGKSKVDCWHEEKNGDLTPRDVGKKSRKYCWFKCDYCYHDFRETIHMITNKNRWCPYCDGRKLCDNDDCNICYNNSFASLAE